MRAEHPAKEVRELAEAFNDMLERLENERRDSARRVVRAQEAERRRVARELHDELGQSLTGVLLQIDRRSARPTRPTSRRPARARGAASTTSAASRATCARTRSPSSGWRAR